MRGVPYGLTGSVDTVTEQRRIAAMFQHRDGDRFDMGDSDLHDFDLLVRDQLKLGAPGAPVGVLAKGLR